MSCCTIPKSTKGSLETKVDFSQYENQLPTYDELKEYVKNTITYCFKNSVEDLYEEKYQGQLWSEFMDRLFEKPMTDIELYSSVMRCVRIWLLPETKVIESDNLFDETATETSYELYWEGQNGQYNKNNSKITGHSFYEDVEFITFLRDFFSSPVCECVSDEEVLKIYINQTLDSMLWYGKEDYDLENRIKTFKNASQFSADLGRFIKERDIDTNGGSGGSFIDSYSYSYDNQFSKPRLAIAMNKEYRLSLCREIDETLPPRYFQNDDKVTVYHLEGNEFWKVAFDVLKGEPVKELSLFDFI